MMCRQCILIRKEPLQSNEICGTFGVKPVCNIYKIASGLCVFFSCTRPLLVFLWSQLHRVQSSIYVDGLWVLLILIFALNGMDQSSNYHTVVAVWWPTEAPEIVLPCSKNKVTDRFINWKGDTRITSPNVVCYISEIQCGEMIKQRLLNPHSTW